MLFPDSHEIEGAGRGDGGVVDPAPFLDLAPDLLLAASGLVAEQHVLGEVRQLLLPPGVRVGTNGQGHADRDHRLLRQSPVPDLQAVVQIVDLEPREGVGGNERVGGRGLWSEG